jgi:hypothetical protein
MTTRDNARRQAMAFLAAYDGQTGDDERRVARIARTWLSLLRTRQSVQRMVNDLVEEFYDPDTPPGGCGWEDLRAKFTQWALAEEWLNPDDPRVNRQASPRGRAPDARP